MYVNLYGFMDGWMYPIEWSRYFLFWFKAILILWKVILSRIPGYPFLIYVFHNVGTPYNSQNKERFTLLPLHPLIMPPHPQLNTKAKRRDRQMKIERDRPDACTEFQHMESIQLWEQREHLQVFLTADHISLRLQHRVLQFMSDAQGSHGLW